jgi:hypothetical protein
MNLQVHGVSYLVFVIIEKAAQQQIGLKINEDKHGNYVKPYW